MPANLSKKARVFAVLLVMNIAASIAHYADNIIRFAEYQDPSWLSPMRIDAFWFLMTPFGIAGYRLYKKGKERAAFAANYVYGAMGMLVLAHYLVLPPWRWSASINALIMLEAVCALALIAYTLRVQLRPTDLDPT
ncbi:MAG: hypothetical protein QM778_04870 [Myxococcales bacterium]